MGYWATTSPPWLHVGGDKSGKAARGLALARGERASFFVAKSALLAPSPRRVFSTAFCHHPAWIYSPPSSHPPLTLPSHCTATPPLHVPSTRIACHRSYIGRSDHQFSGAGS